MFNLYVSRNRELHGARLSYPSTFEAQDLALGQADATFAAQRNTNFALQDTLIAQETLIADQVVLDMTLLFGPKDETLAHRSDGTISNVWTNQDTKNFVLYAVVDNPYASSFHAWGITVRFRRNFNDEYRLSIHSNQKWDLTLQSGSSGTVKSEVIAGGTLSDLRLEQGEWNTILLVVRNEIASVTINGNFIAYLDVTGYQESGDVGLATGTDRSEVVNGRSTLFHVFTLWGIP